MQASPVSPPDVKPNTKQQKRRRRRRQHRKKKKQEGLVPKKPTHLDLTDLTSEASALERQLGELQAQLKINHANMPGKEQGRRANAIAAEQITATEDEIDYVRKSLKSIYGRILTEDITYAASHHIEDKLWRYICYPNIEEVRSKLRKLNGATDQATRDRLQKQLLKRIDSNYKFYRELNTKIKADHHVDLKTIGIDLFRQTGDDQIAIILQSNYICMGDIARYRASAVDKQSSGEQWKLAKECYQKAAEVYRFSGKPYSQLALVSISNGSVIDVVWYYCMSLAMKHPSTVGRDNLRAFYSKIRFSTQKEPDVKSGTKLISHFVESFLQLHRQVMFGGEELSSLNVPASLLDTVISNVIATATAEDESSDDIPKVISSTLHVLKNMLTRTTVILVITIWHLGERMKSKGNASQWPQLQSAQMRILEYGFKIFTDLLKAVESASHAKDKMSEEKYNRLSYMVDYALLSGLSIWCTFLANNMHVISQYCTSTDMRGARDNERRTLVKAIQAFSSCLIAHPMFPDPVMHVLPPTYPISEDLTLLGVVPFARFHGTVDYFKEVDYSEADEASVDARRNIRWGRVRELIRKIAESTAFDFVQYNKNEQKYTVLDENAKRQQQNRFMKALATQRLMEQVSSLEKNVNRMHLSAGLPPSGKPEVYTVVLDVTAFLDGLSKVKKWANQTLNPNNRTQGSILEVIVPLETIDALDFHKKGSSHMNMQARESIRYIDQHLAEEKPTNASYMRTQKLSEQLSDWAQAEDYWIGEESRANIVDTLLSDDEDEEQSANPADDSDAESVASEELFKSRRRRGGGEDESSEEEEEESSEEEEEESESEDECSQEDDEDAEEDQPIEFKQVPRAYIPIISCMLYYLKEHLVLVTNDENLAWWAEMFGDPETGRRLCVKTVDEWDQSVRNMSFGKAYTHSWKKR
ncbi:hypothetical protein RO3G_15814 [Lichtheimia corymbifera JMRC:FSU:9682]|uniref:Uncharacterized protein n=1 Tax=Lichtheimia corymbifera JMRC:FSU:9682 TaxID=1263082 RepID=A0A068RXG3_9FUNG|nr:hypothetical protein RO3G_15814 [Lichtheimia corymbifera JMRC:FSU:9682]